MFLIMGAFTTCRGPDTAPTKTPEHGELSPGRLSLSSQLTFHRLDQRSAEVSEASFVRHAADHYSLTAITNILAGAGRIHVSVRLMDRNRLPIREGRFGCDREGHSVVAIVQTPKGTIRVDPCSGTGSGYVDIAYMDSRSLSCQIMLDDGATVLSGVLNAKSP